MSAFKPVTSNGQVIGQELYAAGAHVFFGNRHATVEMLESLYPDYKFHFVKQVHGDTLAQAPFSGEADAHWTSSRNTAIGVYTADCLPVLLHAQNLAVAIHAGWRGIAAEIVPKAIAKLAIKSPFAAYIGPHLRRESFEVGLDVAAKLESVGPKGVAFSHADSSKKYIDLTAIARHQLQGAGLDPKSLFVNSDNTYNNSEYLSYRRDGKGCGRLISFIALRS